MNLTLGYTRPTIRDYCIGKMSYIHLMKTNRPLKV